MNIKDQVLSIKQILQLQELGFDVIKNSSAIVIIKENDTFIVSKEMVEKNIFGITDKLKDMFYTMTIGDIIDILPHHKFLLEKGYEDTNMYHLEHKFSSSEGIKILQHESGSFLRLLFDNLKWCIINKHIES